MSTASRSYCERAVAEAFARWLQDQGRNPEYLSLQQLFSLCHAGVVPRQPAAPLSYAPQAQAGGTAASLRPPSPPRHLRPPPPVLGGPLVRLLDGCLAAAASLPSAPQRHAAASTVLAAYCRSALREAALRAAAASGSGDAGARAALGPLDAPHVPSQRLHHAPQQQESQQQQQQLDVSFLDAAFTMLSAVAERHPHLAAELRFREVAAGAVAAAPAGPPPPPAATTGAASAPATAAAEEEEETRAGAGRRRMAALDPANPSPDLGLSVDPEPHISAQQLADYFLSAEFQCKLAAGQLLYGVPYEDLVSGGGGSGAGGAGSRAGGGGGDGGGRRGGREGGCEDGYASVGVDGTGASHWEGHGGGAGHGWRAYGYAATPVATTGIDAMDWCADERGWQSGAGDLRGRGAKVPGWAVAAAAADTAEADAAGAEAEAAAEDAARSLCEAPALAELCAAAAAAEAWPSLLGRLAEGGPGALAAWLGGVGCGGGWVGGGDGLGHGFGADGAGSELWRGGETGDGSGGSGGDGGGNSAQRASCAASCCARLAAALAAAPGAVLAAVPAPLLLLLATRGPALRPRRRPGDDWRQRGRGGVHRTDVDGCVFGRAESITAGPEPGLAAPLLRGIAAVFSAQQEEEYQCHQRRNEQGPQGDHGLGPEQQLPVGQWHEGCCRADACGPGGDGWEGQPGGGAGRRPHFCGGGGGGGGGDGGDRVAGCLRRLAACFAAVGLDLGVLLQRHLLAAARTGFEDETGEPA